MPKIIEKTIIKFLFIYKLTESETLLDLGILDNNYKYIKINLNFTKDSINNYTYMKLYNSFRHYKFNENSEVCLIDTIPRNSIIYMYLHLLSQQIGFNVSFVSLDEIPRRICNYHKGYKNQIKKIKNGKNKSETLITKEHILKIWNRLLETEKCPWINNEINTYIHLKSEKNIIKEIRVRLGLYYMLIKKFLYTKSQESISKK